MRTDPDEILKLDDQNSITFKSSLTLPKTIIEVPTKSYVDKKIKDPSIIGNIAHFDFKDQNLENVIFVNVNSMLAIREHLTPRHYVDQANFYHVNELYLLRSDPDEESKLNEQNSIDLNSTLTSPKTILELRTKSYVDSLHEINRNGRDLLSVYNDQDNEFDKKKLTNLDSITVIRNPSLYKELANKNYVDDSIGERNVLSFNQTL